MRGRQIRDARKLQVQVAKRIEKMTDAEISALKPSEVVMMLRAAAEIERRAREVSPVEQDEYGSGEVPTFHIHFTPTKPEGFVSCRLATGEAGYIPHHRVEEFLAENPGAIAIR